MEAENNNSNNNRNAGSLPAVEKKPCDIAMFLAEGIYVINKQGLLTSMNPEAELLLGWKSTELLNKNAHDIIHYQKKDGTPQSYNECNIHNVITNAGKYSSENELFTRKNGSMLFASVVASPVFESGNVVGAVIAFRDVTERNKMQDEFLRLQQLESLGALAGGIAHDFNNLLQAIMGNISFAKTFLHSEDTVFKLLTEAEKASYQARELSYRLLTFSKGGAPFTKAVSLSPIIKQAVEFSLRGMICKREVSIPDNLSPVELDENQMLQVFNEMISNACEAMPEGGLIRISAEDVLVSERKAVGLTAGRYIEITVDDTGHGIPPKNLSRIFDPYFTTKEMGNRRGMGLGLSICHSIITKHGGHISVESREGFGTTFHIWLPAAAQSI